MTFTFIVVRQENVFLIAQLVKNLPAMLEISVGSLGSEDLPEKGKAIHCSILAWRIPWGHKESDSTEQLSLSLLVGKLFKFYKLLFLLS